MLIHWIWLATRPNLTDREKLALLHKHHGPEELYFSDAKALLKEGLKQPAVDALLDKDLKEAQKILDSCVDKDIRICTYADAAYPARLKNIVDPPLVFYYKGYLPAMDDTPVIALVGTRKASAYGVNTAKRMGYQLAKCGAVVVSGLAEGNDGAGATGALMAGGTVIGVLGCGADVVYPSFHRSLYADTQHNGCLLTEFPPGTPPYKWNFPKRNRIISGLSCGVLVVEAPDRSGSLITARLAAEQGRDVFVVPGNIDVPTFVGSNALLREGAIIATCGWDVVSEYAYIYPEKIQKPDSGNRIIARQTHTDTVPMVAQNPISPGEIGHSDKKKEKKLVDNPAKPPYSVIRDALSPEERNIVDALQTGACLVDHIVAKTHMPTASVLATLTMLQIKGIIELQPGNRVQLK